MATLFLVSLVLLAGQLEAIGLGSLIGGGGGGGGGKVATRNVFINMAQGVEPILAQINSRTFSSREERLNTVHSLLTAHAALTQGPLINFLNGPVGALSGNLLGFQSFWISNQLFLKGVNSGLLTALLSAFPNEIASVEDEPHFKIEPAIEQYEAEEEAVDEESLEARQRGGSGAWGVTKIQAPEVWRQYNVRGKGVVVGVIDTGVRHTHEAIASNFRSNYGWYDPSARSRTPNDGNGHGTHCTGTICGKTRGIGVAPDAQWIACKGCAGDSCSGSDLTACGEFMACPTDTQKSNPNCGMAPHIVSNSWGGGGGQTWYDRIVRSWRAAGIIPVFAIGNNGRCNSAGSPGDGPDVLGIASTTSDDNLSSFSSRGPGPNNRQKPDFAAPGSGILSAGKNSNSEYVQMSGTSMACPHAAGVVALMVSAKPGIKYDEVKNAILRRGVDTNLRTPSPRCPPGTTGLRFPNVEYGYGRVNALKCVGAVRGR